MELVKSSDLAIRMSGDVSKIRSEITLLHYGCPTDTNHMGEFYQKIMDVSSYFGPRTDQKDLNFGQIIHSMILLQISDPGSPTVNSQRRSLARSLRILKQNESLRNFFVMFFCGFMGF